MPDQLMEKAFDALLTQGGIASVILGIACFYLARSWAKERNDHNVTQTKLLEFSKEQNEAYNAVKDVLSSVKEAITALRSDLNAALYSRQPPR